MTKRLIINADDYGLAEDVSKGIIECYTHGAVTDMSMLAVGESFWHAAELAKKNNINEVGVHLALTGPFVPVSLAEKIPSLLDKNKRFPKSYMEFLTNFFTGCVNKNEIYTEFRNQIFKIKKENFKITHIDGHQHVHTVPAILEIVIRLMKEENINYVRFPSEKIGIITKLTDPHILIRNLSLVAMCGLSKKLLKSSGVKHNDYFIGHSRAHEMNRENLIFALSRLEDGLTELGCHPGYFTEDVKIKYPYYRNCEEELKALCDKGFADEIKNHSVELVSY